MRMHLPAISKRLRSRGLNSARPFKPAIGRASLAVIPLWLACVFPRAAEATAYFVADGLSVGVSQQDARAMASLVRAAVSSRVDDRTVDEEWRAEYVLQPRLARQGEDYVLTVEKRQGNAVLAVGRAKVLRLEQLNAAARWAVRAALQESARADGRPALALGRTALDASPEPTGALASDSRPIVSGATTPNFDAAGSDPATGPTIVDSVAVSRARAEREFENQERKSRWAIGFGPFAGRHLGSENALYGFSGGHVWEVHPQASVKLIGEGAFSSGKDSSRFINAGAGANYYWPSIGDSMPYVSADVGYGFVRTAQAGDDAEGLSLGAGVGYHFWRYSKNNLDLLLRYATVTDAVRSGSYPAIIGARLAVNF